jgi:hypothetical protein
MGPTVHQYDARWRSQHPKEDQDKSHQSSSSMGRDDVRRGPAIRGQHPDAQQATTGGMVLYDLPQVCLCRVRAIWAQAKQRDASDHC